MREAQPVPGEELPFLYIRTAASTAPDDALEPYPAALAASEEMGLDRRFHELELLYGSLQMTKRA